MKRIFTNVTTGQTRTESSLNPRDAVVAAAINLIMSARVNRNPLYGTAVVPTTAIEKLERAIAAMQPRVTPGKEEE